MVSGKRLGVRSMIDLVERQRRIDVINQIIKDISKRGRKFFTHDGSTSKFEMINNRVYYIDHYTKCKLLAYGSRDSNKFSNGGTLWGLICDFRLFIMGKNNTNGDSGYRGLYGIHWGYPEDDMKAIQKLARDLGYLVDSND